MKTQYLNLSNEDNMDLMSRYGDDHFDLAIVDPPYGINRFKNVTETPSPKDRHAKRFQGMDLVNNTKPSDEYFKELFRVSKNQIIWGANNFNLPPSEYFLCWDKRQTTPNFATLELAYVSMGLKKPAKLYTYSIAKHNTIKKIHQTQKPVSLYEFIFLNYANSGERILDTHLGSMSIALAIDRVNKFEGMDLHLTGCDIDPKAYDLGIHRVKKETRQQVLF